MALLKKSENIHNLTAEVIDNLISEAIEASANAYAPYSKFPVGAALLCDDGTVVRGCNVENSSFGLTHCAERNAIYSAIAAGKKSFVAIAIVALARDVPVSPCGICRQVLSEFCDDLPIICTTKDRVYKIFTLRELLPEAFRFEDQ